MALFIIIGLLAVIVSFMVYGSVLSQKWHREHRGNETMTETDHFYAYLFYVNRDDKRIFVPKRTGGGFTINFANPLSILAGILIIGGFVALILLK